jgi:hypothetical protein
MRYRDLLAATGQIVHSLRQARTQESAGVEALFCLTVCGPVHNGNTLYALS